MKNVVPVEMMKARPKAPKREDVRIRFSEEAMKELNALISHYPNKKAAILPALWLAQREYGGEITADAMVEVAYHLERSYAEIEGVATFYSLYNVNHKVGKHLIDVCTCLSCQLCEGYNVLKYLCDKLNIPNGGTTKDGMFTVHEVECLNACDRAPVIQVGDEYYGPIDTEFIDKLLDKLRNTQESTVVRYADEVVKAQINKEEIL